MTNGNENNSEVLSIPLQELRIDVRLRRALINAGFQNLAQVFDTPESELAAILNDRRLDELDQIRDKWQQNPSLFTAEVTTRQTPERKAEVDRRLAQSSYYYIELEEAQDKPSKSRRDATELRSRTALPTGDFAVKLASIEERAHASLSLLADHAENAIIAECFPRLSLDLDDLRANFITLFKQYQHSSIRALEVARVHFPSAFLVLIAHSASKDFDGDAFWNNLFDLLCIDSQNVQGKLKRAFYNGVKDRGLPHFASEDSDFHLLYTALLHGGFSESFWRPMWSDVILPFARTRGASTLHRRDSAQLVRGLKINETTYSPNRAYARRIIEKAPSAMLEPLIESALKVASEASDMDRSVDGGSFSMMSSYGLADSAMQALRFVLEGRSGNARNRRIVYLPTAELRIRPEDGTVHLHWDALQLPASFAGRAIAYYVNGELSATSDINMGVGKCVLAELDLSLKPSERFDVELVMLDGDEDRTSLASLNQTFDRTRPGSFEFVLSSDGVFRLRKTSERIRKTKVVAFLTNTNLWVVPGKGMTELEAYDAEDGWRGASIQLFEVEPGASGAIINILTREEIACWQEDYRVEIDRSHIIGKTSDKRDLYGFSYVRKLGTNASLPEIVIEAHDASSIRGDLDISCVCDGQYISLPWEVVQDEVDHDYIESGRLFVKPREASRIGRFVKDGLIRIEQRSTGQTLLNYKFAVVPARSFGIEELFWSEGELFATYALEAMEPITMPTEDGDYEMLRGDWFYFDAPLAKEVERTFIRSDETGKTLEICLYLANVSVDIPEAMTKSNSARPLCMADVDTMDGRISITSTGRRHSRVACVMMGMEPLLWKKLSGNTTYSFDIFNDPSRLSLNGEPEEKNVVLILSHGEKTEGADQIPASAEIVLARCTTGYNLGNASLLWRSSGLSLCFENAAPMDFEIRFSESRRGKSLGVCMMDEGETSVRLPDEARYQLDIKKTVVATVVPMTMFGETDESMSMTFELQR